MNFRINNIICIVALLALFLVMACVKDKDFEPPKANCPSDFSANITISELKSLYVDELIQIQEDLVIEGYVVSSDLAGNFFGTLHIQDSPTNPTQGLQLEVDLRDSHLFYEVGSKILLKTKGLYLGMSKGAIKLGGVFSAFGNPSVGRLPAAIVGQHILNSCDPLLPLEPTRTSINELDDSMISTLVQLNNIEIILEEVGQTFALKEEETIRTLTNCEDLELELLNSGYSDFQANILPEGNGTITGVLIKDNKDYQLVIRDSSDMDFTAMRCEDLVDEFTSTKIFISELADPDNNAGARFVELYNSDSELLDLKGWTIRRYTNANTEVSSSIDLSGFVVEGNSTFVVSPNALEFELIYGFPPDHGVSTNSPADSNGDDNLQLVDPFGNVIDSFGVVGEDGSGTNHEFEDGRAFRNENVTEANPVFSFIEWTIFNDSGEAGTINRPQNAPEDFNPGIR
ncbi:lamin tail domain-containing protein [Arenibacter sp. BSSL-BM3]|uniref:Lamin tail domain-containing protein n=1 Tax=Arenibacter arenosicollis TaxID=2762274 RepID=A0ABR7QI59_9FLAO|nr:DUF5689 domain-containing protein [Arenibacter arenosicollis]MBC8766635.1 lamin tail domain-containing protein [Arenibacter arenosicollis]